MTLIEGLNAQIQKEFQGSYNYLAMSIWAEDYGFGGLAHWLRVQAEEEWVHGLKFSAQLLDIGETPRLLGIDAPTGDFGSPIALAEAVLGQEKTITAEIDDLLALAEQEDGAEDGSVPISTLILLDWFVKEQVKEEKAAQDLVEKFMAAGDDAAKLLAVDKELGKRKRPTKEG